MTQSPDGQLRAADIEPGVRLRDCLITQRIGSGGMGIVWKAKDRTLHRTVAVKVLHQRHLKDDFMRQRFRREAWAMARCRHENVARVISLVEQPGLMYMVMEYIEGQRLSDLITEEYRLPLPRAIEVFRQVAAGLSEAHKRGIIHRDVKPGNIMVCPDGRAVLADFGLAKMDTWSERAADPEDPNAALREFDAQETPHGALAGTPAYLAPERWRRSDYDHRCDIYSLGASLYHTITGETPFGEEPTQATIDGHIRGTAKRLSSLAGPVPELVQRITDRCMTKDPERRFQSAGEVERSLGYCLRDTEERRRNTERQLLRLPIDTSFQYDSAGLRKGARLIGGAAIAAGLIFALFFLPLTAVKQMQAYTAKKKLAAQQARPTPVATEDNLGRKVTLFGEITEPSPYKEHGWKVKESGSDVEVVVLTEQSGMKVGDNISATGVLRKSEDIWFLSIKNPDDLKKR